MAARSSRPSTRRPTDDEGSASLEFLFGGVLLLVPVVYLVVVLAQLEAASFAADVQDLIASAATCRSASRSGPDSRSCAVRS